MHDLTISKNFSEIPSNMDCFRKFSSLLYFPKDSQIELQKFARNKWNQLSMNDRDASKVTEVG